MTLWVISHENGVYKKEGERERDQGCMIVFKHSGSNGALLIFGKLHELNICLLNFMLVFSEGFDSYFCMHCTVAIVSPLFIVFNRLLLLT